MCAGSYRAFGDVSSQVCLFPFSLRGHLLGFPTFGDTHSHNTLRAGGSSCLTQELLSIKFSILQLHFLLDKCILMEISQTTLEERCSQKRAQKSNTGKSESATRSTMS